MPSVSWTVRWLWPARTALACFLASLPHLFLHNPLTKELLGSGLLFAAICAVFVSNASLGATCRVALVAARASAAGGLFAAAVVAAVGTSPVAVYLSLAVGSLVIVLPNISPVSTRLCWATYTGALVTSLPIA